jgi:hypothetical protein
LGYLLQPPTILHFPVITGITDRTRKKVTECCDE